MSEIYKNRTIRPTTRQQTSSYKVNTEKVGSGDTLIVTIVHESKNFRQVYRFKGSDLATKNSIHFSVTEAEKQIAITWSGAQPLK